MISIARAALFSFLLTLPAAADPAEVVRAFYDPYAKSDANAAAALATRANAKLIETKLARTFHTRCEIFHDVQVGDARIDGDTAFVDVQTRTTRWSAMRTASMRTEEQRITFTLRREQDAWKIDAWRSAEDILAERIAAGEDVGAPKPSTALVAALCRQAARLSNRSERTRAAETVAYAERLAGQLDDPAAHADVLAARSILLRYPPHQDAPAAVLVAERAVELAEGAGDPDLLARALLRLSRAQFDAKLEDIVAAERAFALAGTIEDASLVAMLASRLAHAYDTRGLMRSGLRYARLAAHYAELSGDETALLSAMMNASGAYALRADVRLALPYTNRALEIAERTGFITTQASVLAAMAEQEWAEGDQSCVIPLLDRALALLADGRNPAQSAEALDLKLQWYASHGRLAEADAVADELQRVVLALPEQARREINIGWLRVGQGRFEDAEEIAARQPLGFQLPLRAAILGAQGRTLEARPLLEQIVATANDYRRQFDADRHRARIFVATGFATLVENYLATGEVREALAVAERAKARVLRELLAARREAPANDADVEPLNARIVELNRRVLAIQRDGGDASATRNELRRARAELDEALSLRERPGTPILDAPALDPASIRAPDGVTVLVYVANSHSTTVFAIRGSDVRAQVLPIARRERDRYVANLLRAIELRDATYRDHARAAYDAFVRPVLGDTPREPMLCIIPDERLWQLPFQSLIASDGKHLIEHAPMFYAPSLSLLAASMKRDAKPPTILALGDPAVDFDTRREIRSEHRDAYLGRLPDAEKEITAMQRFYGERLDARVGAVAAEGMLKRNAANYDVLHFATHGLVDDYEPMYSALLLAGSDNEDGLLEAREILSLPLHDTELVVLSACNSARGEVASGEGVLGLSWAFLATGCPRIIATQWRIGSAAAARLMIGFHRRMAQRGAVVDVAKQLRDAQVEVLRTPQYAHPYYWAGFVLIGREH